MSDTKIVMLSINDVRPYEKNPRRNDEAVQYVANSIKEFGWKQPIVVDKNNVVVVGHTRLKAAQKLGLKEVPCVIADDLTDKQVKAYRIADNKVGEIATWDFDPLNDELQELQDFGFDMGEFGFYNNFNEDEFDHMFESQAKPAESSKEEAKDPASDLWQIVLTAQSEEEAEEIAEFLKESGYECEVIH